MLKVGLTGGIASGKSTIGGMFKALGCELIQSDQIAHELMSPGENVYEEVLRHFGASILTADGRIDRRLLAEAAFGAVPSRIQELNRLVHPAVFHKEDEWTEQIGRNHPHAIAIVEAALILETGGATRFDRLIVVTCSEEQRVQRWAQRRGVDEVTARREVAQRMAAQLPDEAKIKAADHVIDNSGSLAESVLQVRQIFAKLKDEQKHFIG